MSTGRIIDGKAVAASIRGELAERIAELKAQGRRVPGLTTILVGDDAASKVYVGRKQREAKEAGMVSEAEELPGDVTQEELIGVVREHCERPDIDGVLVQLPLPEGLDEAAVIDAIDPRKDVDGLHPINQGALFTGREGPRPCTPLSCMTLVESTGVDLTGLHAVVVGRSVLVGKPVAMLLLERHATVTICHSRTRDLAAMVGSADVLIAAVGRPEMIKGEWVKPGAIVIDVGINRVDGKLIGDVEFEAARRRAAHITPVPGGVGPMTVATLLRNTYDSCLASQASGAPSPSPS